MYRLWIGLSFLAIACSSDAGGAGGDGGNDSADASTMMTPGRFFPDGAPFYQAVEGAALDPASEDIIDWLDSDGGWGTGTVRIDFSLEVVTADASAPMRSFNPTNDHFSPDCDIEEIPIPAGGAIEAHEDYNCDGGDCHLIVVATNTSKLYEMWHADIEGESFDGGCLAVWDMTQVYGDEGRGYDCTSADAAGLPITPLLFTADEVAAGEIDHAIRFILPNERIRADRYVAPATHSTPVTAGPDTSPAYGQRLRLRADYPLESLPNDGARTVARAMQKYGIILADGGNIALTARSDRFTTAKWDGLLGPRDLEDIAITDMEVVDTGEVRAFDGDCTRVR